jgi:hypothetical protein
MVNKVDNDTAVIYKPGGQDPDKPAIYSSPKVSPQTSYVKSSDNSLVGMDKTGLPLNPGMAARTGLNSIPQYTEQDKNAAKELVLGVAQTTGGVFEVAAAGTLVTATSATVVGAPLGAAAGSYIALDGGANFLGGLSRIGNAILGTNAGDNLNYMKAAYKVADPVNGERNYNISQVVMGSATLATGSLKMVTNVGIAGVESGGLLKYTGTGMDTLPLAATSNFIDAYNVSSTEKTLKGGNNGRIK